jgi:hypothetical protein
VKRYRVRLAGIGFAVLVLVSEVLKGDSPSPNAPPREIVDFLVDERTAILAGAYVQMLALFLAAFAIVSVTGWPDGVADRLARLGLVLTLAAYTAYVFLTAASAYGAADLPAGTVKALWQVRFVSETFVAFPAALLIGASAWASRARRRYAWFSAVVAAAFLVGGASLAREGFFAPDGGYGFILFWLLPLWVVVTAWSPRTP